MGLASYYGETVDSVPPAIHGGNIDDRRIGKGATMYYPVQVLSCHAHLDWAFESGHVECAQDALTKCSGVCGSFWQSTSIAGYGIHIDSCNRLCAAVL